MAHPRLRPGWRRCLVPRGRLRSRGIDLAETEVRREGPHRVGVERFDGLSGGALWQDLKLGVDHLTHWERIALVTDIDRMIHLTALFGWMTPGELKRFPLAEREAAIAWAAATD